MNRLQSSIIVFSILAVSSNIKGAGSEIVVPYSILQTSSGNNSGNLVKLQAPAGAQLNRTGRFTTLSAQQTSKTAAASSMTGSRSALSSSSSSSSAATTTSAAAKSDKSLAASPPRPRTAAYYIFKPAQPHEVAGLVDAIKPTIYIDNFPPITLDFSADLFALSANAQRDLKNAVVYTEIEKAIELAQIKETAIKNLNAEIPSCGGAAKMLAASRRLIGTSAHPRITPTSNN